MYIHWNDEDTVIGLGYLNPDHPKPDERFAKETPTHACALSACAHVVKLC